MLCCLVFAGAYGQQEGDVDTVNVMGAISNHHTGEPEPFCLVQFLDGERLVAGTMSDEKGTAESRQWREECLEWMKALKQKEKNNRP